MAKFTPLVEYRINKTFHVKIELENDDPEM